MKKDPIRPVATVTLTYLAVATIFAFRLQNWEFVFYIIVVLAIGTFIAALHRRVDLSRGVLWGLCLWGLLHMTGGLVPTPAAWPVSGDKHVFYSLWLIPHILKYDQVVHAYGFGFATWASWQALRALLPESVPSAGVMVICVLAGMGLGALNEVVEFIATLIIPDTNVGDYANTGWDLISNLVGAVIAAFIIRHGDAAYRAGKRLRAKVA